MPSPNQMPSAYDSGHPTILVQHPSGNIHEIPVAPGVSTADMHANLMNAGFEQPDLNRRLLAAAKQPDAEGAVENSEDFKAKARQAWEKIGNGSSRAESGFWTGATGRSVEYPGVTQDESGRGHVREAMAPSALGAAHTHNNSLQSDPSKNDIQQAKNSKKNLWVITRAGLFAIDPEGKVTHVFKDPDWMKARKKK